MEVKQRKRRQQIRDALIAARLENAGDKALLNIGGAAPTKTAREEAAKCSAESYKRK